MEVHTAPVKAEDLMAVSVAFHTGDAASLRRREQLQHFRMLSPLLWYLKSNAECCLNLLNQSTTPLPMSYLCLVTIPLSSARVLLKNLLPLQSSRLDCSQMHMAHVRVFLNKWIGIRHLVEIPQRVVDAPM